MDKVFFALIGSALTGEKSNAIPHSPLSDEVLLTYETLAKRHDVYHLLALGLKENDLLPADSARFRLSIMKTALRCERLMHAYGVLSAALEAAEIPFIPLKGSVLRKHYREPWMRTSCDIDVLVHPEDVDRAVACLADRCGYTYNRKTPHDISLFTPEKIHVELHFALVAKDLVNKSSDVLARVWDFASPIEGHTYFHELSDAMFYFYHIAHMGQHFLMGGCGIRPFMDLFILEGLAEADRAGRESLLCEAELSAFAEASRRLSAVWFAGAATDATTRQMEEYLLTGGVYGTLKNQITITAARGESRLGSFLSLAFPPSSVLKKAYPRLGEQPALYPFYVMRRWLRIFTKKKRYKVFHLTKVRASVTEEAADQTAILLSDLGLYR